ncbi:ATP-dependent RNA helicase DHX33-like [Corticium candelabrum]|uniref:ATP-dependent RNA helicase DHX33-like n=1 Tax=Corticium candelabrum TaxID=121492 RepID=UPI002E2682A8|nr:ATP-dependent RNA helicase DHX33-like [Corticium candelabrum]
MQSQRRNLPIFSARKSLLDEIMGHNCLIIIGETGSGKTTQIPQYLYEAGLSKNGVIACTQPRRVAATTVAERVAAEMGVRLGAEVGYSVRFDDCSSFQTRVKYMTDGMLLREAMTDQNLMKYSVVILDEAHERTLHTDILFGIIKAAKDKRAAKQLKSLKVIVTSATLHADQFSVFFGGAKVLYIQGRQHPVEVFYTDESQTDYLRAAVVSAFQIHQEKPPHGDILVFLTGQDEIDTACRIIKDCQRYLPSDCPQLVICPFYAALPSKHQTRVFSPTPSGCRKIILATNIAETSITIPGVKYVIDTGMVKAKSFDPQTQLELLTVRPVSKAQARQRLGRAGREESGVCYRLFTEESFECLAEQTVPEIQRCNLSTAVLELLAVGVSDVLGFDFMDKPSKQALQSALELLCLLGGVEKDEKLQLSVLGKEMSRFPIDPKLAKVVLTAKNFNCLEEAVTIAALMSSDSVLYSPPGKQGELASQAHQKFYSSEGDHVMLLNIYRAFKAASNNGWCNEHFINKRNMKVVSDVRQQLRRICEQLQLPFESCHQDTSKLRQCLTSGFFVNVAEYQKEGHYITVGARQPVAIHPSSCLFHKKPAAQYLLYNEIVYTSKCYMRNVSVIDSSWLHQVAPLYFRPKLTKNL